MQNTTTLGRKIWAGVGIVALSSINLPLAMHLATGTTVLLALASAGQAATLTNWQFNPGTRQLEILVPEGTTPRYFLLAEPARIVLDLPNTQIGAVPVEQGYSGAVRQIRIAQFQPDLARIVIELAPGVAFAPGQVELQRVAADGSASSGSGAGDRWILRPLLADDTSTTAAASPPAQAAEPMVPRIESTTPASPSPTAPSVTTNLPPLEPNAIEIPVVRDEAAPPNTAVAESTVPDTAPAIAPSPVPSSATVAPEVPARQETPEPQTDQPATAVQAPTTFPPATFSSDRPATISVPPLTAPASSAAAMPPARNQPTPPGAQVSVPPLQTAAPSAP
ncbi:AMIN domain-containing protein, partial [Oculatella sp. LEGE 06141]|uniref:AMIN domain-containing protein n=1 Tax=Oculatella sp. LEGE 06141 TaxID=1828648 RepID=UPI00187ED193